MNEILVTLVKLQKMDAQIAFLNALENGSAEKLAAARQKLTQAEEELAALTAHLDELKKKHRTSEAEIADLKVKIEANQGRQLKAKNNEEYRALLKEADFLRQSGTALEDELLKLMESTEQAEAEIAVKSERLEALKPEYEAQSAAINTALEHGLKEREALMVRREELAAALPSANLSQYRTLFSARKGQAVAGVENGLCLACHLAIPPQSYNELQRNQKVITCANCNRIIYWKEHPDFAATENG